MEYTSQFNKGIHSDNSPLNQPEDTARYVLNGVQISEEGDLLNYTNEKGTVNKVNNFPSAFSIIGGVVLDTDLIVILVNPTTGNSQVGYVDHPFTYVGVSPS